jgi:hypothetical protein
MEKVKNLVSLRNYCRENEWPRLPQWQHWIYSKKPIAQKCIKMIGGVYYVNLDAFQKYLDNATINEHA